MRGLVLLAGLGKYAIDETLMRQLRQRLQDPSLPADQKSIVEQLLKDGATFFANLSTGRAKRGDFFFGGHTNYWRDWIAITKRAADAASRVQVPSLVLCGTKDLNVTLEDCDAMRKATSRRYQSRAVYFDGLDHFFAKEGDVRVDPAVLDAIASWGETLR